MPCSNPEGKPYILQFVIDHQELKTFVDFACGQGTYAHLIKGTMPYKDMTGVEIWGPYIKKFSLHGLYNKIVQADIRTMPLPDADCAIIGDIIEHFDKEEAKAVFKRIDEKYPHVILSMPPVDTLHGGECGNPHEAHKSLWTVKEIFEMCGDKYKIKIHTPPLVVCIK